MGSLFGTVASIPSLPLRRLAIPQPSVFRLFFFDLFHTPLQILVADLVGPFLSSGNGNRYLHYLVDIFVIVARDFQ